MTDILEQINQQKRDHIREVMAREPLSALESKLPQASPPRGFKEAIERVVADGDFALIAEIKKASPSKGVIRPDFDPRTLAQDYQRGGATCLSILTDEPYFQGSDQYLVAARNSTFLPVLRKDFMLESYQIVESRVLGADCILLIMASLSDAQAQELESTALALGMDVLVEVHNREELDRALLNLKSRLLGINNRDLKTFVTDLKVCEELSAYVPNDYILVGESGIFTHADLQRLAKSNIRTFLVGESLMRQANVTAATRRLLTAAD